MRVILWGATFLGAIGGAFIAATGVLIADGAPQEAAAAAIGAAMAVIPYALARAWDELTRA